MSERTINLLRGGISVFIGTCCILLKVIGTVEDSWPYAAAVVCLILTIGYLRQAFSSGR